MSFIISHSFIASRIRAEDIYADDTDGSISYPSGHSWAQGEGCGSYALSPDGASTYGGIWHDTTYYSGQSERSITFTFTGVGIPVYFIVPDKAQGSASVDTSLTFTLDGSQADSYSHSVSGSADFLYNQRVFSRDGLSNGEHTIVVRLGDPVGNP